MRRLGAAQEEAPKGFMSPAGWKVLQDHYKKEASISASKLAHEGIEAPKYVAPKVAQAKTRMPVSTPVVEKKEEAAVAKKEETKKEETATPEPEAGTNWAMIGLGAAAIGAAAYYFMKHNK